MEDLVMKIFDIEDRAQEVIRDAREADEKLESRFQNEAEKLEADIVRRVEIKRETLKKLENEDADKKIEEINSETDKQIAALENKYKENKDKWVSGIVENIIGR